MKKKNHFYGALVRCSTCGDKIQSKHTHDWVCCSCYTKSKGKTGLFVDGGGEYLRMGGKLDGYTVISEGKYRFNG